MRQNRRVLMLCYFFPPTAATGAVRPASFCGYLEQFGFTPRVLTPRPDAVQPPLPLDHSLSNLHPPDLDRVELDYRDWRNLLLDMRAGVRRLAGARQPSGKGASNPRASSGSAAPRRGFRALLSRMLDGFFMFPDQQKFWKPAVVRYVRALPAAERPDVVYATGSPWSSLLTGVEVARILDVPFVADFRDPWAVNLKSSLEDGFSDKAARLERSIVQASTRTIANTEALRQYFLSLDSAFSGKVVTLNNGINRTLLDLMTGEAPERPSTAGIQLDYFGTVSRLRMPRELLCALDELAGAGHLNSDALRVNFTGAWAEPDADTGARLARLETLGIVARHAPIPHDACLREMRQADHLLVLQPGYPLQIPAKIYEYMATGRPMIIVGGEGATADLVQSKGLGRVCPDDRAALKTMLAELVEGRTRVDAPGQAVVDEFSYENLTGRFAEILSDSIEAYSA